MSFHDGRIKVCVAQCSAVQCRGSVSSSWARHCRVEFIWTDEKGKKMKGLTAPQYIDYVCSHMQSVLDDDAVFPTSVGMVFPFWGL